MSNRHAEPAVVLFLTGILEAQLHLNVFCDDFKLRL